MEKRVYSPEIKAQAIAIHEAEGIGSTRIGRRLGVPYKTVQFWLYPKTWKKARQKYYKKNAARVLKAHKRWRDKWTKKHVKNKLYKHFPEEIKQRARHLHDVEGWGYSRIAIELGAQVTTVNHWCNPETYRKRKIREEKQWSPEELERRRLAQREYARKHYWANKPYYNKKATEWKRNEKKKVQAEMRKKFEENLPTLRKIFSK